MVALLHLSSFAQKPDTTKYYNEYIGIQANKLLSEIFNFNDNSSAINPYLITYSVNNKKSGHGFNAGIGYSITNRNTDNESLDNDRTFNDQGIDFPMIDNDLRGWKQSRKGKSFNIRVGYEKKSQLSKCIYGSLGLDLVYARTKHKLSSENTFVYESAEGIRTSSSNTLSKTYGIGPRGTLNFQISNRFILGTEMTYYYLATKTQHSSHSESQSASIQADGTTADTRKVNRDNMSSDKSTSLNFEAPVTLYMIIKF